MHYHLIGIGGIGMSGLARMLLQRGHTVSGSDRAPCTIPGATIYIGHKAEQVPPDAIVVWSSDIAPTNPERQVARTSLHRSELLASLVEGRKVLAVTGTHGKTTTTSLLTWVLQKAGWDPGYAIGGMLCGTNAHNGTSEWFVLEADESDGSFLRYGTYAALVTNIDTDHIAHYGSWEQLVEGFRSFMERVPNEQLLLYTASDPTLQAIGRGTGVEATNVRQEGWNVLFDTLPLEQLELSLVGEHNAANAALVVALAQRIGVPEEAIREGLRTFPGVRRRMERKHPRVIDDYGHHPREVAATLQGLRAAVGRQRIVAVYQPHRYSRMKHCLDELPGVFNDADTVVVTDLYTAGEAPLEGVSTEAVLARLPGSLHVPRERLVGALHAMLGPNDVVIFFGAGDSTKAAAELAGRLTLHVERVGSGPPVLLLHGWGHSLEGMRPLGELLPGEVHLVDLPGFGRSPAPDGVWSGEEYADRVVRYMDEMGLERVDVIGHSFGGKVALLLAHRHPQRVRRLVLLAAQGIPRRRSLRERLRLQAIRWTGKGIKRLVPRAWEAFAGRVGSADYRAAGALRPILVRSVHEDVTSQAAAISQPTLLLWGTEDRETPPDVAAQFEGLIAKAQLRLFPAKGHNLHQQGGEQLCASYIVPFLGAADD